MRKKNTLKVVLKLFLLFFVMLYGMLAFKFQLPPYSFLRAGYVLFQLEEPVDKPKQNIPTETEVNALISIKQAQDIFRKRNEVLVFLWGNSGLPSHKPAQIVKQFFDDRYKDIASLKKIEKLTILMDFGLESNVYHFIPKDPNNKAILYHQGHGGDFYISKEQIETLMENGYSVVAFSMPLLGLNNKPSFTSPRFGKLQISSHDNMKFLTPRKGHPIKYFIEPVITTLNYLEANYKYSSISMIGISGGGWTTTIAAAVDVRIAKSFSVAGTYPMYLRSNSSGKWGDFEQSEPELYSITNYLELYILGAHGLNRKQLQIFNKYDPCCFEGVGWKSYKDVVIKHIRQLGKGEFDIFLDKSHEEHIISPLAMKQILDEIGKN